METPYLKTIEIDDLPNDLQPLARLIGMEHMRALLHHFAGERVYIPTSARLSKAARRYTTQHYRVEQTGQTNIRQLAQETGLSIRTVERYVRDTRQARHSKRSE